MKPIEIYRKNIIYYKLNKVDAKELWDIISPICKHEEFIKRCNKPFFHHDNITLGEHIICDAIKTYQLSKKRKKVNIKLACLIAMFHDLYEIPWQNVHDHKKLFNKHGFVHPIEASINALTWYPNYFTDDTESIIIIDGIIHHMYPFPVRSINGSEMNLNNNSKYISLSDRDKEIITFATKNYGISKISIRKSKYIEGRIMSNADKKVALGKEIHKPSSLLRLIHGNNNKTTM